MLNRLLIWYDLVFLILSSVLIIIKSNVTYSLDLYKMRLLHTSIRSFRSNIDKLNRLVDIFEPDIFGLNKTHFEKDMDFDTFKTSSSVYTFSNYIFRDKNNVGSPPISGTSIFATDKSLISFSKSKMAFLRLTLSASS